MNGRQKIAALLAEKAQGRTSASPRSPTMNPQIHSSPISKMPTTQLPQQVNYLPMPKEPGINKPLRFGAIKQKLGKI